MRCHHILRRRCSKSPQLKFLRNFAHRSWILTNGFFCRWQRHRHTDDAPFLLAFCQLFNRLVCNSLTENSMSCNRWTQQIKRTLQLNYIPFLNRDGNSVDALSIEWMNEWMSVVFFPFVWWKNKVYSIDERGKLYPKHKSRYSLMHLFLSNNVNIMGRVRVTTLMRI